MIVVRILLIAIVSINTAYSLECNLPDSLELTCEKTRRVKSMDELNTYLSDYAVTAGKARNLLVDFDIDTTEDLNIHSPCVVKFKKERSITSTANICVNALNGIRFQNGFKLKSNDLSLYSKKRIIIRDNATVEVRDILLRSNGETEESRSHIRHSSNIKANNLNVEGFARATLGHSSVYNVTNQISLNSSSVFSSVWKNTIINTKTMVVNSETKSVFAKGITVNAQLVEFNSPECRLNNIIINGEKSGNCFSEGRPIARLKVSSLNVFTDDEIVFDAKKSKDDKQIVQYDFFVNNVSVQSGTNPTFTTSFSTEGLYYTKVIVKDEDGFTSSKSKKVTVSKKLESDKEVYFNYLVQENELTLIFHQLLPIEQIKSAKFNFNNGEEIVPLSDFYHLAEIDIPNKENGKYNVLLEVEDIYGNVYNYERLVSIQDDDEMADILPIVDFEIYQTNPKEVFLDLRKTFDPYGDMEDYIIEWGDDTSDELSPIDEHFSRHTYSSIGTYEVTFIAVKSDSEGNQITKKLIKTIDVTNIDPPSMNPIVDFGYVIEEFAPYVTFNINLSASPTDEIASIIFDHGDGTIYTGTDIIHPHFYAPGVYNASLTVTDSRGVQAKQIVQFVITEAGPPNITVLDCERSSKLGVECEIVAVDKESQISSLSIDWGDGESEEISLDGEEWIYSDVEHEYALLGNYEVTFSVNTYRGETTEDTASIEMQEDNDNETPVNELPVADMYCYSYETHKLECNAESSIDYDGYIVSYRLISSQGVLDSSVPFFDLEFPVGGVRNVRLEVVDNLGSVTGRDFTPYVELNNVPYIYMSCLSDLMEVSCDSNGTIDFDGHDLSYEWIVDGAIVSNSPTFNYISETKGTLNIVLNVRDLYDLSSQVLSLDVSDNLDDFISPSLACTKVLSDRVICDINNVEFEGLTFEWYDENILLSESKSQLEKQFDTLGSHTIRAIVSNGIFSKEVSNNLNLIHLSPKASFIYSMNEDGDVVLDASPSLENGKFVTNYKWEIIEDLSEHKSYKPKSVFRYETIQGKTIRLTVIDGLNEESSLELLVDLSMENRPPVAEISYSQPRGKASKKVFFSAAESLDPDGDDLSYSWSINGEDLSGSEVEYLFDSRGDKTVELMILDSRGKSSTRKVDLKIEEVIITGLLSSYKQLDYANFRFENYVPIDVPFIMVNDQEVIQANSEGNFIFTVPAFIENVSHSVSISFDNEMLVKNIILQKLVLTETPDQDLDRIIDSFLEEGQEDEQTVDRVEVQEALVEISESLKTLLHNVEDIEAKKLAVVFLESYKKNNFSNTKVSSATGNRFYNPFIQNTYAIKDTDLLANSESCSEKLFASNTALFLIRLFSSAGKAYAFSVAGAGVVSSTVTGPLGLSATAYGVATYLSVVISEMISSIIRFEAHKRVLLRCISTVRFPYLDASGGAVRDLDTGDIPRDSSGVLEFIAGAEYDISLRIPGLSYASYRAIQLNKSQRHHIYSLIDDNIIRNSTFASKLKSPLKEAKSWLNNPLVKGLGIVFELQQMILDVGFENKISKLIDSSDFENSVANEAIEITEESLISFNSSGSNQEFKIAQLRGSKMKVFDAGSIETKKMRVVQIETTFFQESTDKSQEDIKYRVISPCDSEQVFKNGGGYRSKSSIVDRSVVQRDGSVVCHGAKVYGNVTLGEGVTVSGSGTRISSYRNKSSNIKAHSNPNKIYINGPITIGSSSGGEYPKIEMGVIPDNESMTLVIENNSTSRSFISGSTSILNSKFSEEEVVNRVMSLDNGASIRNSRIENVRISDINSSGFGDPAYSGLLVSSSTILNSEIDNSSGVLIGNSIVGSLVSNSRIEGESHLFDSVVKGASLDSVNVSSLSLEGSESSQERSISIRYTDISGESKESSFITLVEPTSGFGANHVKGGINVKGDNKVKHMRLEGSTSSISIENISYLDSLVVSQAKSSINLKNISSAGILSISYNSGEVTIDDIKFENSDSSLMISDSGDLTLSSIENVKGLVSISRSYSSSLSESSLQESTLSITNISLSESSISNGEFRFFSNSNLKLSRHSLNDFNISVTSGSLGNDFTMKNSSSLSGKASIGNSVTLDGSTVRDGSVGDATVISSSSIYEDVFIGEKATISSSTIQGLATIAGGISITDSYITGRVNSNGDQFMTNINSNKAGATCDGIDDDLEGDRCNP